MSRCFCCSRLLTAWSLIVIFTVVTITQLCFYLSRTSGRPYVSNPVGNFPRRRSELSLCPLSDIHQRKFPLAGKIPYYRCKNPRKKMFSHLDPKKYVFARYLAEINGTRVEESNKLNLIANAIDLNGYVVQDNSLLTSNCFLSVDKSKCSCSCFGDPNNCSAINRGPTSLFDTTCLYKPDTIKGPDNEEFQKVLCDNGLPRLMTIDSFLHNSYRNIVFVHPINKLHPSHSLSLEQRLIQDKLRLDSPIINCAEYHSVYNMSIAVLADLNALSQILCLNQFRIVGVYCIAAWYKSNDLGMYWFADDKVSVIFTSWIGLDRDDSDILMPVLEPEPKGDLDEATLHPSEKPTEDPNAHGIVRRRHHSSLAKMVLQQTKKFIRAMAQGKQYIVVHVRIDNSFSGYTQRADFPLFYQSCLFKIKSQLNKLVMEHPEALVFFFMDYGNDVNPKQNSSASNVQIRLVNTVLLANKHEIQHYSADTYGGRSDTPFVTLVEQEFMCRASYLLTVGGGQIQDRLKKRFLKMHFRKKLLDFEYCDVDPASNTGPKYI